MGLICECKSVKRLFVLKLVSISLFTITISRFFIITDSKFVEGFVSTNENWVFLARFCFLSQTGTFLYQIEYPMNYAEQKLLLYFDESFQWSAVYKTGKNCTEKESVLKEENYQIIHLNEKSPESGCTVHEGPEKWYRCQHQRNFLSARERWWFIAMSNCDSDKGLKFKYRFRMTNGEAGNIWREHFSADEFCILEMDIAYLIFNILMLMGSLKIAVDLKLRHLLHATFKMYICSVTLQCFALMLMCLAYSKYALRGWGLELGKLWGNLFHAFSLITFLALLMLLAKGYTVTRGRLSLASTMWLSVFLTTYSITYAALFIYQEEVFDPGEVLYVYESPAGYCLIALRLIGWSLFALSVNITVKHYPEKRTFYYPFFLFYSLWFISGPVIILIANFVLDKWVREKVVTGVELGVSFTAHFAFLMLALPSSANKNFPYHVRTTQIGAMESPTDGGITAGNLDAFAHHTYAPSSDVIVNACSNVFVVSQAISMVSHSPIYDWYS